MKKSKMIQKAVLSLFIAMFIFIDVHPIINASEIINNQEADVVDNQEADVADNPEGEVINGDLYLEGEKITPEEFEAMLQEADVDIEYTEPSKNARSVALLLPFAGSTLAVAGFGVIAISAAGYVTYKGIKVTTGWVINSVNKYFGTKKEAGADNIPGSLKTSRYQLNLSLCKKGSGKNTKYATTTKSGNFNCGKPKDKWTLSRDTDNHSGSYWKVKKNGVRKASIDIHGRIVGN